MRNSVGHVKHIKVSFRMCTSGFDVDKKNQEGGGSGANMNLFSKFKSLTRAHLAQSIIKKKKSYWRIIAENKKIKRIFLLVTYTHGMFGYATGANKLFYFP